MFVVKVPDFWGTSFLQLPTLQGVSQAFTIEGIFFKIFQTALIAIKKNSLVPFASYSWNDSI